MRIFQNNYGEHIMNIAIPQLAEEYLLNRINFIRYVNDQMVAYSTIHNGYIYLRIIQSPVPNAVVIYKCLRDADPPTLCEYSKNMSKFLQLYGDKIAKDGFCRLMAAKIPSFAPHEVSPHFEQIQIKSSGIVILYTDVKLRIAKSVLDPEDKVRYYPMGDFEVHIPFSNPNRMRFIRFDGEQEITSEIHPHIEKHNHYCLGSFSKDLFPALNSFEIPKVIRLIDEFLQCYNHKSPLINIVRFMQFEERRNLLKYHNIDVDKLLDIFDEQRQ